MKISRLRPGSGFALGFGAFFTSFLPLSLFPIGDRMPQLRPGEKTKSWFHWLQVTFDPDPIRPGPFRIVYG